MTRRTITMPRSLFTLIVICCVISAAAHMFRLFHDFAQ